MTPAATTNPATPMADPSLPPGSLALELVPRHPGLHPDAPVRVTAATGSQTLWVPGRPAILRGFAPDATFELSLTGPILFPHLSPMRMPSAAMGARLTIPVIPLIPADHLLVSDTNHRLEVSVPPAAGEGEPNSELGVTDQLGPTIHAFAPASLKNLREAIRIVWDDNQAPRTPNGFEPFDAVVRVSPNSSVDSIETVLRIVEDWTQPIEGINVPIFRTRVALAHPPRTSKDEEALQYDYVAGKSDRGASDMELAQRALLEASALCGGPGGYDGLSCSTDTLTTLWMHRGELLARGGDQDSATHAFSVARALTPAITLDPVVKDANVVRSFSAAQRIPAPRVELGSRSLTGRLAPDQVQSAIESRLPAIRACLALYPPVSSGTPSPRRVGVRFIIGATGETSSIADSDSDRLNAPAKSCIFTCFENLRFPRPESGLVTVVQPVHFW